MSNGITPLIQIQNDQEEIYYDPEFMLVLQRNLPMIKETAIRRPIDIKLALKFAGNLDGLLIELEVPHDQIWITTILNGYKNCYDFDGRMDSLLIPSDSTLRLLVDRHTQIQRML